jgi:hypothetical protein
MTRECRNCQWWEERESRARPRTGNCHGTPPVIWIIEGEVSRMWPIMEADEWCGAFRLAERKAGGISDAEFDDAHRRMAERLATISKGTKQ